MAKRKRLTPAQPGYFNTADRAPETKSMPIAGTGPNLATPPIAQVAGEAATLAALDEVTAVLQDARAEGRLIEALPLSAINARYLVRDRLVQDDEEMASLMDSLRARGQQTPIEVTALSDPSDGRSFGLISGWRRLTALNRLYDETKDDRFATIKALVVTPGSAQDAYVAMVEENEIRVNLSLYERANIALRAAREGVFPTPRHAVLALFGSTTRSKRSKIGSFMTLVETLDPVLLHPSAIPEKLGLGLVRALQNDPELARKLKDRLIFAAPETVADELKILAGATAPSAPTLSRQAASGNGVPAPSNPTITAEDVMPGLRLRFEGGRIELSGDRVDDALYQRLRTWLAALQG